MKSNRSSSGLSVGPDGAIKSVLRTPGRLTIGPGSQPFASGAARLAALRIMRANTGVPAVWLAQGLGHPGICDLRRSQGRRIGVTHCKHGGSVQVTNSVHLYRVK